MNRSQAALFFLMALCSCHSQVAPPATQPTLAAVAKQQKYENQEAGIAFTYPAGWKPVEGSKSQLQVQSSDKTSRLTLDVPKLPFHIPGMIPVDSVASGYIDNEKKRIPDQTVTHLPDTTLPEAKQRRVKLSGHVDGKTAIDEAVLIVHNDRVYILAADGDEAGFPAAHAALEAALQSLQWTK